MLQYPVVDYWPSPMHHLFLQRLGYYAQLIRLDKPIGVFLLLWPTLWALWVAGQGKPDIIIVIIFVLGVFLMRAAGCAINDFADRNIDGFVERTRNRPLARGFIKPIEALAISGILALAAFGLVLLLNTLTIYLAIIGAGIAAFYPFSKRFTHLPQVILGLAFSWSIPMAFAAITGDLSAISWTLFFAAWLWTIAYDTQYAMRDRADDLRLGIKSTAILFARYDRAIIAALQCAIIVLLLLTGLLYQFSWPYYLGLVITASFFIYQHVLIKRRDPEQCFRAFSNNNWVGLAIFLGILVS